MTITITNSGSDDVNEYANTSGAFTVLESEAGTETFVGSGIFIEHPRIVKVTASQALLPGLSLTVSGSNSIPYTGHYDDVFDRHWKYVMANNTKGDVPRVSNLPPDYLALYAFIPPSSNATTVTYSFYAWNQVGAVPSNLSTIPSNHMTMVGTHTITIHYNWASDVAAFKDALAAGTLYQQALAKGLVG